MGDYDFDEWVEEKEQENDNSPPPPEILILQKEIKHLKRKLQEGSGKEALIRQCCAYHYDQNPPQIAMPPKPTDVGKGTEQIAVAHISDTQLGKQTMSYDAAVCAKRLHKYAQTVVEITKIKRTGSKIKDLRLYLGGDMVEGEVGNYPSQPYDVHSSVIRQAMKEAPDMFEGLIYYFLEHFEKVHIIGVPGNHGRNASRHATRHLETNWDRVFYWNLHDRIMGSEVKANSKCPCGMNKKKYKNCCGKEFRKRITWDIPEGDGFWALDRVWGWGNLVVHGDQIRGWAGIPYYGVNKKASGWADCMPKDWDNLFFGHFHTFASGTLNYRRWFCNGTTESDANYPLEQLAAAGDPCQRLLFMTEKHGVISDHQIFVEDRNPIMHRKLKQAAGEFADLEELNKMVAALVGGESSE